MGGGLKRITVLGDSISNEIGEWPYIVEQSYNKGQTLIINRAVSGASIITDADGDDDLAAQVISAASDNADLIIIALGTNDNNAGNMETLQSVYETAIVDLKASNTSATVYGLNVLPKWSDATTGPEVDKANIRTAIAAACTAQGVACWDTYTDPWITQAQTSDGTHPTAAGSAAIAAEVLARL